MDLTLLAENIPETQQAGTIIGGLIISIGLSLLARLLFRQRSERDQVQREDAPTTISTRGSYIPLLIGRYRLGYVFGWAGDREVRTEKIGSTGGKGGGGGEDIEQDIYYEAGWHQVCIGPATRLEAIYQNGEAIWTGDLTPDNTPNGTAVDLDNDESTFRIYWGQVDQPINTFLGDSRRVGISSRWPHICYVVWDKKRLGTSAQWPQIEYLITAQCEGNTLTGSDYELTRGGGSGVNPAHALYQLLTAPWPHGAGIDAARVDKDSLEAMGVQMASDLLPSNMRVADGAEAEGPVQAIMQDAGYMLLHAETRLAVQPIREASGSVPSLDDDVVTPPATEFEILHGERQADRLVFEFTDEERNWRTTDIKVDDDSVADELGRYKPRTVPIEIATHIETAGAIARRRMQEELGDVSDVQLQVLRAARHIKPGQLFDLSGVGRLRVTSVKIDLDSPHSTLDCLIDTYAIPDTDDSADGGTTTDPGADAEPDIAFTFVEIPADLSGGDVAIAVLRIRAHDQISGADVYASADGTNYTRVGSQDAEARGGVLESGIGADTGDTIASGPLFEADNFDIEDALDLSGDTTSWQNGRQIAVINDEAFYLESVTVQSETDWAASTAYSVGDYVQPTSSGRDTGLRYKCIVAGASGTSEPTWPAEDGGTITDGGVTWEAHHLAYRLNNLIRAQLSTAKQAHSAGDRVYIAERTSPRKITDPIIAAGENICVKTRPRTRRDVVALSSVAAVCKDITGAGAPEFDYLVDETGDGVVTETGDTIETVEAS